MNTPSNDKHHYIKRNKSANAAYSISFGGNIKWILLNSAYPMKQSIPQLTSNNGTIDYIKTDFEQEDLQNDRQNWLFYGSLYRLFDRLHSIQTHQNCSIDVDPINQYYLDADIATKNKPQKLQLFNPLSRNDSDHIKLMRTNTKKEFIPNKLSQQHLRQNVRKQSKDKLSKR